MADNHDRTWRIGELAEAVGLTVRALHHHDQIGLLRPSLRTSGGHRLYGEADVARLYEIVALRGLGLQLEQIRELLTSGVDPRVLLDEQLRVLNVQLKATARLRDRLSAMRAALDGTQRPTTDDLLALTQQTVAVESLVAEYLSLDQRAHLARRQSALGETVAAHLAGRLASLYQDALTEYDAGTEAHDPKVRAIVAEIDETSAALSAGDEQVTGSVRLWAEHGEEVYPGAGIPWAGLVDYLDLAREPARVEADGAQ